MRKRLLGAPAALLIVFAACHFYARDDERAIRKRLHDLVSEFNASTTDGLGTVARAARIGSFFTEDVIVELGQGTAPIRGRATVMDMAARLQPRTAAFSVELDDVSVAVGPDRRAEVHLTAAFRRRSSVTREETLDAREFTLEMIQSEGEWRINRANVVDTLK
jgi:hypothetical protein